MVKRNKLTEQVSVNLCLDDRELLAKMAEERGLRRPGAMARVIIERALDEERVTRKRLATEHAGERKEQKE